MNTPRPEYPRPHFDRSAHWLNLNGDWDFAPDPTDAGRDGRWHTGTGGEWPSTITVPFPWEHSASGVRQHWLPIGWYRRRIARPHSWANQRTIIHFGAVHHVADIWVNGIHLMSHIGGYLPFEADITDALDVGGAGWLVVRVEAPLDKRAFPHGKQRSVPADDYDGCAFTPSSGIWQTVWLEPRPQTYLAELDLRPSADLTGIEARVRVAGPHADSAVVTLSVDGTITGESFLPITNPRLWTPDDPHLYYVTATVDSDAGTDTVTGYTGLRRVEWHDRLLHLNGAPIYVRGVLDQGFWPECGHTAPSDEALRRDVELARAAGYNLVRKHLKAEDPRWLYWADRLGMLVWAEPASTGRFSPDAVAAFEAGLTGMIRRDANHPSIIIWGAYNEEWGLDWDVPGDPSKQEAVRRGYHLVREIDPTRPVVDNSGWAHVETDLVDWHYYAEDAASWASVLGRLATGEDDGFPVRLGPDFTVTKRIKAPGFDDTGKPWLNGEYGGGATSVERGWHLRWQTQELRRHERVAGYIYTELYDIEHETVGVYTDDRRAKDLGGVNPADVNADTTLILELLPHRPGADLIVDGSEVSIEVRVSHHGTEAIDGRLRAAWTQPFGPPPAEDSPQWQDAGPPSVTTKPFLLSESVRVRAQLPTGWPCGRLHLFLLAAIISPVAVVAAPAGQVLYSPNLTVYPQGDASYPRVIRLDYDGNGGNTMLATFARRNHGGPSTMPIYRSTNGGQTWSASPISTVTSNTPGWGIDAPTLYEVPRTVTGLPQGTLLAAGTAWVAGDFRAQKVEVFKSTDHGVTWQWLSNCTQTSGLPNTIGHGIWEPWFHLAPNNTLACFISDERPASTPTNNQIIGHYTSTNGGVTWSSTITQDLAFPANNLARPGMSIITPLPNGTFMMTYEMCRDATDADHACEVYIKISPDGLNWAPASNAGTLVRTVDGRELLHTPYVAWLPGGGPNGTLLLSGQRVVSGPTGNKAILAESGKVLFANTNLGVGAWHEIEAPVNISPTGGYNPGEPACPGYSSPLVPKADGTSFLYLAGTWLGTGNQCQIRFGTGKLGGPVGQITGPATAGKCVDVDTNTADNGRRVILWDCGVALGQRWSISADGTIRAFGKCLDIIGNATANLTKVQLWDCTGAGGQQWRPQANGSLRNPQSGRCLDSPGGATANGTWLQIWDCNGLHPQKWNLPGYPTGPITGPAAAGKCVDVDTNTPTSGNKVHLWSCNGVPGQQWTMHVNGTVRAFGKCLDIVGNATANLSKVQLWDCGGAGGQQWVPQANGSMLNPQSGRCLDSPGGATADGTWLQILDCNASAQQRWTVPV